MSTIKHKKKGKEDKLARTPKCHKVKYDWSSRSDKRPVRRWEARCWLITGAEWRITRTYDRSQVAKHYRSRTQDTIVKVGLVAKLGCTLTTPMARVLPGWELYGDCRSVSWPWNLDECCFIVRAIVAMANVQSEWSMHRMYAEYGRNIRCAQMQSCAFNGLCHCLRSSDDNSLP